MKDSRGQLGGFECGGDIGLTSGLTGPGLCRNAVLSVVRTASRVGLVGSATSVLEFGAKPRTTGSHRGCRSELWKKWAEETSCSKRRALGA